MFKPKEILKRADKLARKRFKNKKTAIDHHCLLTCEPVHALISHYVMEYNWEDIRYKQCLEMINKLKECPLTNTNRLGVAAAIIYMVANQFHLARWEYNKTEQEWKHKSQKEIMKEFGIARITLYNWAKKVFKATYPLSHPNYIYLKKKIEKDPTFVKNRLPLSAKIFEIEEEILEQMIKNKA